LKPLGDAQKIKGMPTFHIPPIKISDWMRWKGIAMSQNKKIKKPTTIIFFKCFFCSDDLKWNYTKNDIFKKLKKSKINNVALLKAYFPA
jgi:hypothetical protein